MDSSQWISFGRVKAGRDQDKLRFVLLANGQDEVLEGGQIGIVVNVSGIPANVDVLSFALPSAHDAWRAGLSRIERALSKR